MLPPQAVNFNIEALSGICGSISIACWVVVFSPQIIENFRRGSADGLSLLFLIVWLAGDVFNILGAVLQGVLPTMIILAVYYTLADIVLLGQCFYYRGFNIRDELSPSPPPESDQVATDPLNDRENGNEATPTPTERSSLLPKSNGHVQIQEPASSHIGYNTQHEQRPTSSTSAGEDAIPQLHFVIFCILMLMAHTSHLRLHLSTRMVRHQMLLCKDVDAVESPPSKHAFLTSSPSSSSEPEPLTMDPLGQVFGYLCAVLYLGSRLPQLLLNFRRKSTDGVSLLFFLFACIGNLTYVLSILAYSPVCQRASSASDNLDMSGHRHRAHCRPGETSALYGRYVLVNLSWLVGSAGTLFLDMAIFVQFFLYRDGKEASEDYADDE
ncbi:hypothetical protein N7450_005903 [Penicillium hetheringtonii]|uniref:PQ loop repeat protein n=1 Tax=Penicillium hetheringtonii TaxID=911720 RepID=A0AAD6GTI5_9EURO|nr:hypothetical protein N7450_005903 [Penicillium hetheringtonii]